MLPVIFGALKVRRLFFNALINELLDWFFFKESFAFIYLNRSSFSLISFFFSFLVSLFYLDHCFFSLKGFHIVCPKSQEALGKSSYNNLRFADL